MVFRELSVCLFTLWTILQHATCQTGVCQQIVTSLQTYRGTTHHEIRTRTIYRSQPVCCGGYEGDGVQCNPLCNRGCVNGRCTNPNECHCNTGWSGPTCDIASEIGHSQSTKRAIGHTSNCTSRGKSLPQGCVPSKHQREQLCSDKCCQNVVHHYSQCKLSKMLICISEKLCSDKEGQVRLASGSHMSGRVEVCVNGEWGTVCNDHWDNDDASVVCYQLGLSRFNALHFTSSINGSGPIHMDDVHCSGSEVTLLSCDHTSEDNCDHSEDASVTCQTRTCEDGAVRLAGTEMLGSGEGLMAEVVIKGRVELCWNEMWGSVCDQSWTVEDATVVCRELGFSEGGAFSHPNASFGQGTGPILLSNINCTGDEDSLVNCIHDPIGQYNECTHADDVGVSCKNGKPQNVTGHALSSTSILMQWNPSTIEHHIRFYIVQCAAIEFPDILLNYTSSMTYITIDSLHPYSTYNCSVSAVTINQGPFSANISITTLEDVPSGAPRRLSVADIGPRYIHLSWTEPKSSKQNGIIRHYQIYVTTLNSSTSTIIYVTPSSSPVYNLTALHPYTSYEITVAAFTISAGPKSIAVLAHTEEDIPSAPVQGLSLIPLSPSTLLISWESLSLDAQNGELRYYTIKIVEFDSNDHNYFTTSSNNFTAQSLHPYYLYRVSVAAATVGLGPYSPDKIIRMPEAAPSSAPLNVSLIEQGSTYALMQWLSPLMEHHNGIIKHYQINLMENTSLIVSNQTTSQTTINIKHLQPNTLYSCSVAAVTVATGPFSLKIYFTTDAYVPGTVQSLEVITISPTTAQVLWQPPLEEERHGLILDYQVNVTHFGNVTENRSSQTTNTSIDVYFLHPNYLYRFIVASRTSAGLGPHADIFQQLPQDAPSGYPVRVNAVPINSSSFELHWSPPPEEEQNGAITHYGINITVQKTGETFQIITKDSVPSHTLYGLHPHYKYTYSVTTFTTVGNGPYSSSHILQMPQDVPSTSPFNLTWERLGSTYVLLRWSPPLEESRNGVIQHYQVHLKTTNDGVDVTLTTDGALSHMLIPLLKHNTKYSCSVTAITIGPGPPSTRLIFTTISAAPTAVQNLVAIPLFPNSANISWEPPLDELIGSVHAYQILLKTGIIGNSVRQIFMSNSTSILVDSLLSGAYYMVTVTAMTNDVRHSPADIVFRQLSNVPSGYPRQIIAKILNPSSFTLYWDPPLLEQQNGDILHYIINITEEESENVLYYNTSDSDDEYTFTHLHPHYHYHYQLTAVTEVGHGPFSPVEFVQLPEDLPSSPPLHLLVKNTAPGLVSLAWLPPAPEHQNGVIIGYVLRVTDLHSFRKDRETEQVVDTAVTSIIRGGLRTTRHYNFTVAAVTLKGRGPFSDPAHLLTLFGVPPAPAVGVVERLSAAEIRVYWSPISKNESGGPVSHYTVKYYPLTMDRHSQKTTDNLATYVNTSKNEIVIGGLDPVNSYAVSVAANSEAGRGNFSKELISGLSENGIFQLFFTGTIDCQQWVLYHIETKLDALGNRFTEDLESICKCQLSSKFVLFNQPHCLTAHSDWLIVWGRIIGTNSSNSTNILQQLQAWVEKESKVVVEGVPLTTLKYCSVFLKEGEPPFCESPAEEIEGVVSSSDSGPSSLVTYIIVGIVIALMIVVITVLACLATVVLYKRKKVYEKQMRFHESHPLNTFDMPAPPGSADAQNANEDYMNIYDTEDGSGIYETIMDPVPYATFTQDPFQAFSGTLASPQLTQKSADPEDPATSDYDNIESSSKGSLEGCSPSPMEYNIMKPATNPNESTVEAAKGAAKPEISVKKTTNAYQSLTQAHSASPYEKLLPTVLQKEGNVNEQKGEEGADGWGEGVKEDVGPIIIEVVKGTVKPEISATKNSYQSLTQAYSASPYEKLLPTVMQKESNVNEQKRNGGGSWEEGVKEEVGPTAEAAKGAAKPDIFMGNTTENAYQSLTQGYSSSPNDTLQSTVLQKEGNVNEQKEEVADGWREGVKEEVGPITVEAAKGTAKPEISVGNATENAYQSLTQGYSASLYDTLPSTALQKKGNVNEQRGGGTSGRGEGIKEEVGTIREGEGDNTNGAHSAVDEGWVMKTNMIVDLEDKPSMTELYQSLLRATQSGQEDYSTLKM